jgi:hypothetical protein
MRLSSAELDRRGYAGDSMSSGAFKPNLLAIVPPYAIHGPPAGAAALLAYLKAAGCRDFGFLDLRLFAPDVATPTYRMIGAFGESFVLDIPDLPLVLAVLENVRRGRDPLAIADDVIEPYCVARGINTLFVRSYLQRMAGLVANVFDAIPDLAFIGFSTWTSNYLTTLLAAAHLKHRARPPFIVAGGPQVSQSAASAQLGLRSGLFDAVAVGEGEETLLDLYEHYSPSSAHSRRRSRARSSTIRTPAARATPSGRCCGSRSCRCPTSTRCTCPPIASAASRSRPTSSRAAARTNARSAANGCSGATSA